MRIPKQLEPLFDMGVLDEVLQPLMSGKEASASIVRSEGEVRCAKVYKNARTRSFKARSAYMEGRKVRNSRQARAMAKKSSYGKSLEEQQWQNTEVDALYKLAAAGVRVPTPHLFVDAVLIMDLILDAQGNPAPRLCDVPLTRSDAKLAHDYLVRQCVRMLSAGIVHGDLSEYNVLAAWDGPVIIDLPQAVDAAANRNAKRIFERDLDHLTDYLSRFAPELSHTRYAREIWRAYERGKLHPELELSGQVVEEEAPAVDGRKLVREVRVVELEEGGGKRKRRRKRGARQQQGRRKEEDIGQSEWEAEERRGGRRSGGGGRSGSRRRSGGGRGDRPTDEPKDAPKDAAKNQERPGGAGKKRRRRRRRRRGSGGGSGSRGGGGEGGEG